LQFPFESGVTFYFSCRFVFEPRLDFCVATPNKFSLKVSNEQLLKDDFLNYQNWIKCMNSA